MLGILHENWLRIDGEIIATVNVNPTIGMPRTPYQASEDKYSQ